MALDQSIVLPMNCRPAQATEIADVGLALSYLADVCTPVSSVVGSWQLRSANGGHSWCHAQGPRSVGGTLPWLAWPLGTASLSTCGLHHYPKIHLRKNSKLIYLAASALGVFSNWTLYKLTYSLIFICGAICSHRN